MLRINLYPMRCVEIKLHIFCIAQEPELADGATVMENIEPALASVRAMLDEFNMISVQMGEDGADIDALSSKMDRLQVGRHMRIRAPAMRQYRPFSAAHMSLPLRQAQLALREFKLHAGRPVVVSCPLSAMRCRTS